MSKLRIIVVDDSALARNFLRAGLNSQPDLEVVAVAKDAYEARDQIVALHPDAITLDLEMPKMDGLEFIEVLMEHWPLPIVVVSGHLETQPEMGRQALKLGAAALFPKTGAADTGLDLPRLAEVIRKAAGKPLRAKPTTKETPTRSNGELLPHQKAMAESGLKPLHQISDKVIVIGASTGGTEAIKEVLTRLPPGLPGIVMVQHMPHGFTKSFADRLNSLCPHLEVREAKNGDEVYPGLALLAPGALHMTLKREGGRYFVEVKKGEPVNRHMPSVDVIFDSAAKTAGAKAVGVILTGMGNDGAAGLLRMRQAGARTLSQDEKTCVVYGMPREAWLMGGSEKEVPLDLIASEIAKLITKLEGGN